MSKANQHVVPHAEGWAVRSAGAAKATSVHQTKQDAIDRGREIARKQGTELVIHGKDGQIQQKDSHGSDPFPPPG